MCAVLGVNPGGLELPLPTDACYIGLGVEALFVKPSPWCNPFELYSADKVVTDQLFHSYAEARADLHEWLSPLFGKHLVCDCHHECCHGHSLARLVMGLSAVSSGAGSELGDCSLIDSHGSNTKILSSSNP